MAALSRRHCWVLLQVNRKLMQRFALGKGKVTMARIRLLWGMLDNFHIGSVKLEVTLAMGG